MDSRFKLSPGVRQAGARDEATGPPYEGERSPLLLMRRPGLSQSIQPGYERRNNEVNPWESEFFHVGGRRRLEGNVVDPPHTGPML